jgi:bifunctional DNase/RNase
LLVVLALVAATLPVAACKRRARPSAPAPAESALAAPAPPPAASSAEAAEPAAPLPVASAVVPSPAVFADGGAPKGYERATVWDIVSTDDGAAVLVLDASSTTVLPIFVGGTEAMTIRLRLSGERYARPLTHDLLASLVNELGGRPVKAQIDDLRDDTFYGSVFVRQGDRVLQIDARPSDAIAIALGSHVPLFVSRSVMLGSGVSRAEIEKEEREQEMGKQKKGNPISL